MLTKTECEVNGCERERVSRDWCDSADQQLADLLVRLTERVNRLTERVAYLEGRVDYLSDRLSDRPISHRESPPDIPG